MNKDPYGCGRRTRLVVALLAVCGALCGCESEDRSLSPSGTTPDIEGRWSVTEDVDNTTAVMEIEQDGNRFSGTYTLNGSETVYDCSGYVTGDTLTFTVVRPEWDGSLYFSGSAGAHGMSGTLSDGKKNKGRWVAGRAE